MIFLADRGFSESKIFPDKLRRVRPASRRSKGVATSNDRVAISRFTFEMGDPKHLGHVLNVVRNVEGVYDVYRVTSAA